MTSFGPGANPAVRRVTRSWKIVTSSGLMMTIKPHSDGEIPCVCTAETGSTVSIAT